MRALLTVPLVLFLVGCAFVVKVHYEADDGITTEPQAAATDRQLVGIALSGGGSRAAVFGAAGLEALWEHGLLEDVDYVSSVSGGSIAASYYVKKRFLDGEAADEQFFEHFRAQMRYNYWRSIEWRQFWNLRWLSGTRRATSLSEVLDDQFLDELTLGEMMSLTPYLLVNTTLYDNGRRLVITTLAQDEIAFDFESAEGFAKELARYGAVQPMTFAHEDILGAVPSDMPLSLAVAASASFPPIVGPVSVHSGRRYWHIGDGGVFDNTGIETLEQVFLQKMRSPQPGGGALIIGLDSGLRADSDSLSRERNFFIAKHMDRVVDIPMRRAEAYHDVLWEALQDETEDTDITKIVMHYTDSPFAAERLPASCVDVDKLCADERCGRAIDKHIGEIPTHFKIDECNADLMEVTAHAVVHSRLEGRFPLVRDCVHGH